MSVLVGDFLSGTFLLALIFGPAIYLSRSYWRDLFRELAGAWHDVNADLP